MGRSLSELLNILTIQNGKKEKIVENEFKTIFVRHVSTNYTVNFIE